MSNYDKIPQTYKYDSRNQTLSRYYYKETSIDCI